MINDTFLFVVWCQTARLSEIESNISCNISSQHFAIYYVSGHSRTTWTKFYPIWPPPPSSGKNGHFTYYTLCHLTPVEFLLTPSFCPCSYWKPAYGITLMYDCLLSYWNETNFCKLKLKKMKMKNSHFAFQISKFVNSVDVVLEKQVLNVTSNQQYLWVG